MGASQSAEDDEGNSRFNADAGDEEHDVVDSCRLQTKQLERVAGRSRNVELIKQCREDGRLFEDNDFPATDKSLTFSGSHEENIQWLRPHDVDSRPRFISDGFSRSDVGQGELGNCWILASLAGLAERPGLIRRIVPPGQSMQRSEGYCGAFTFRLRRFGEDVDVIVDDRLPARNGQLLYAQPVQHEFWVCLLEKALAKLCGCYQSLESGHIFEALTDMTGGVCEQLQLSEAIDNKLFMAELTERLEKWMAKGCVIGASSISSDTGDDYEMGNGLVYSHAYTVTGIATVQQKRHHGNSAWRSVHLLRLRNPWGCTEWQGEWSDAYDGWSDQQRRAVGLVVQDDGEFWMAAGDFVRFYESIDVLHLAGSCGSASNRGGSSQWRRQQFRGEWLSGSSAGGQPCYSSSHWRNPSFVLELSDSSTDSDSLATCLVCLEEPNQRDRPFDERSYTPKAVYLYELEEGIDRISSRNRPVASSAPFVQSRTRVHTFRVRPGRYCIVPCTFEPDMEAAFLLTVFTEA